MMQPEQTMARPLPGIIANEFNTTLLDVPNGPAVNYLIGPRGATVSALEQASACRIDVQKGQDMVPGSSARTVTITHPDEARRRLCEALIRYKVVDFEEVVQQPAYHPAAAEDQYDARKRQRADYAGYPGQGGQPAGQTTAGWWGQIPGAQPGYGQPAPYNAMQPAASSYGMPQQAAQMGYAPAQGAMQQAYRMPQQGPPVVAAHPMQYAQPAAMAGQPSWAQYAGNAAQPANNGYAAQKAAPKGRGAAVSGVPCNGVRINPASVPGGQSVILDVPDGQAVSYLIGTKGLTIIALQAQTGCRVDIQKARDMAKGCVFRQVTVTAPEAPKRNRCIDSICSKLGELKRINPSSLSGF